MCCSILFIFTFLLTSSHCPPSHREPVEAGGDMADIERDNVDLTTVNIILSDEDRPDRPDMYAMFDNK